jgi:hypothetical protein
LELQTINDHLAQKNEFEECGNGNNIINTTNIPSTNIIIIINTSNSKKRDCFAMAVSHFEPDQKNIEELKPTDPQKPQKPQKRRLLSGSEPTSTNMKNMSDYMFLENVADHIKDMYSHFRCELGLHETSFGSHTSIRITGGSTNLFDSISTKSSPGPKTMAQPKSGNITGSGIIINIYFDLCTMDISSDNLLAYIDFTKKNINIMRTDDSSNKKTPTTCTFDLSEWQKKIDDILDDCIQLNNKMSPGTKSLQQSSTSPNLESLTGTK